MPAAAVIQALIIYINVVAVKKLVVEFLVSILAGFTSLISISSVRELQPSLTGHCRDLTFYFEKIRVFKADNRHEYYSME